MEIAICTGLPPVSQTGGAPELKERLHQVTEEIWAILEWRYGSWKPTPHQVKEACGDLVKERSRLRAMLKEYR